MNNKSYRNVLATSAFAAMLLIPTVTEALATDGKVSAPQAQQNTVSTNTEVVVPTAGPITQVKSLKTSDATEGVISSADLDAISDAIVAENKKLAKTVTFTYTGDTSNMTNTLKELNTVYRNTLTEAGNDYLWGTISKWGMSYANGKVTMTFTYLGTPEQEAFATEQVEKIAASLTKEGMSDLDKIRAVNDYVVTNTVYSKTAKTTPHHIYAYLKEGKAVCQAYALLTYRLLTEMGIEARYVVGDGNGVAHAWNSVKLADKWYHIDTTWNDGTFNGNDIQRNTSYKYFLVTSDSLSKDHTWDKALYPVATDETYSYLHDVYMGIEYKGTLYYSSKANQTLNTMNLATKETAQISTNKAFYFEAFNDVIYYANFSNGGALTSYDLTTKETKVIDTLSSSQIRMVDEVLLYKAGGKQKQYDVPLTEEQSKIKVVKDAIKAIKTTNKTFLVDVEKANTAYTALDSSLKESVTNYATLQTFVQQIAKAKVTYNAIEALDGTSVQAIIDARTSYNALDKTEKTYVSNLATLTKKEAEVKNVTLAITAIKAIDPTSTKFVAQATAARAAYTKAGTQQSLITNAALFLELESQAKALDLITKLNPKSPKYIAEVTTAKTAYDALTKSEHVTNKEKLDAAVLAIKPAQAVVDQISKLDDSAIAPITAARTAFDALSKTDKVYVTNLKTLTTKEAFIKNALAAVNAIKAIDPASTKFVAQVTAARTAYNKAGAQQGLVTNAETFLTAEPQAKVFDLIAKLNVKSPKYIAEVTAAKTAFDALTTTDLVSNEEKLTTAVDAIKPAQAVVDQISKLDDSAIAPITAARTAFDALSKTDKVYVTNLKALTTKETFIKNALAAVNAIKVIDPASTKFVAQVTAARTAYNKAGAQQNLVTNAETFLAIEPQAKAFDLIAKLNVKSPKYIAEVTAAKTAFDALETKTLVTNSEKLATGVEAIKPAQAVVDQISKLEGTAIEPIMAAREAFNTLSKTDKVYVTNLKALTAKELEVKNAIAAYNAIKAIDINSTKFVAQVATAKTAYTKAGTQQNLVTNSALYLEIEPQAKVYDLIAKLNVKSPKYIAEVTAAKTAFDALDKKNYITNSAKLMTAVEAIKPAQAVVDQISKLDGSAILPITAAREAFGKLSKAENIYVTNLKTLTAKELEVKNALAAFNAINAIDVNSTKFVAQVAAAKVAYTKAGTKQNLVTNSGLFLEIEPQAKVYDMIAKLNAKSAKYIAEVTAAFDAFDALDKKNYIANGAKLMTAVEAIKPAQAVVAQIDKLDGNSINAIINAREAYTALPTAEKIYVTNLVKLANYEKPVANVIKVIATIQDTVITDVTSTTFSTKALAMKKAVIALGDKKSLVTNIEDYDYYVAIYEIKNAQKTRKWTDVSVATFETLEFTTVTEDNFSTITAGFNKLAAGTGTSDLDEIEENINNFLAE